jgi:pimeloyl-ACP methyl ester carboxylesterase
VLVFQHAWLGSLRIWDGVIPHLANRYRCIAVDTRGCGQSGNTPDNHNLQQYADDLLELTAQLGIDRFTLIGHSSGGVLGTYAALEAPKRVERLVLVGSIPSIDFIPAETMAALIAAGEAIASGSRETAESLFTALSARPPDPAILQAGVDQALANSPENSREAIKSVGEAHNNDRLDELTMPTLSVTGANDVPFVPAALRTMQELPDATMHIFSRVGHMAPIEVPAELAAVIDDFVQHGTGKNEPKATAVG